MKTYSWLLLFLLFLTSSISPQGYKLVWSDEFDSTSLNQLKWVYETGNNGGWGNNELEYYTNRTQNCSEGNGYLTVTAAKESYSGYNYTSARIKTQGKFSVKYGKIEARLKLPYGQGLWPAFWMLGDNINSVSWPGCGEIDIMEMIGGQGGKDKTVYGSAHWGGDYSNAYTLSTGILADDFHIFDITWDQKKIVWHIDGITYSTLDITPTALSAFQKSFFIIFNLAVGGSWPGSPDNTTVFPQTMQADYVRVYQDTTAFPSVSIVSPTDNSTFPANSNITLIANASMQNGTITKVEFYQDALKIGETYVSPFQMTWDNVLPGTYRISGKAYSSTGTFSNSASINVNVGSTALTSPYGGTPAQVPGTIEAENFDLGGQNNAYNDSDTPNDGGQYRTSEGVDIEACSDVDGGYDVGWVANNEWISYTISVKDSGTYQIGARVSSTSTSGSMHFEIDGTDVTGIMNAPNTGGWQVWNSVLSKNFTLTSGIHHLKFFVNSSGFNINKFDIYPPSAKPSINFVYPDGGEQYSQDSIVEVKWNSQQVNTVNLGFSTNGGTFWSSIKNGVDAHFGVYRWKVPVIISSNCKLIIMSQDNTTLYDTSKGVFSVGVFNSIDNNIETLKSFSLGQNFPNPFNPSTLINYHIPATALVNVSIYNLLGKLINTIVDEEKVMGDYSVVWNGKDIHGNDLPSGIYFYSLHANNYYQVKKMVLLK